MTEKHMPDGGEQIFNIESAIAKAIAGVSKPATLIAAEDALAAKEAELDKLKAEVRQLMATPGQEEAAGAARRRWVAALDAHGKTMNASSASRSAYYRRRALALLPVHAAAVNAIAAILDTSLAGASWGEIAGGDRMRGLVAGANKIATSVRTWSDHPIFVLPMANEDRFRGLIGRYRGR